MLELNKILVVINSQTDSLIAVEKAAQLARYADSELEFLSTDYSPYLADGYYFDPIEARKLRLALAEKNREELETLAIPLRDEGLKVTITTLWGNPPYEQALNHIKESNPSIVIKGTSQHNKLARMILSNEDWELVRYCPVPLLLTKGKPWEVNPLFVASVDPGHQYGKPTILDHKLIDAAQSMSTISGGSVHLFHCKWIPPLSGLYPLLVDAPQLKDNLRSLAIVRDISAVHCHLSEREIQTSLPALTEKLGASAIVMGAVSRSRLDRLFIGNTAEKILDYVDCDVLIVKPPTDDG